VETLSNTEGSVTIIGAVSPQGADFSEPVTQNTKRFVRFFWALDKSLAYARHYPAINWNDSYSEYVDELADFSEPVTQNTKRFVRCFWALDKSLAYARHYPAINWNDSYSEYVDELAEYYHDNVDMNFMAYRQRIANILHEESKLMEIVKLIGSDVLPEDQKLTIEIAAVVRIGFLQQNAYHKEDTYVPLSKQFKMMNSILNLYDKAKAAVADGIPVSDISKSGVFDKLNKMKYDIPNDKPEMFNVLDTEIEETIKNIKKE
jgi:V/A-type H+-transporting ATPase subunit A